ncbi:MAG: hypothetical protein IT289_02840 [Oligoflexia bacterium]|nr:hypothetical protein [Oligoflexia bacterium]
MRPNTTFLEEAYLYFSGFKKFDLQDWLVYVSWIGLMSGLLVAVTGFLYVGTVNGVKFPAYAYNVAIGTFIFVFAIAVDTIGHRTLYKKALQEGEALVHHMTISCGITSCLALCLCYNHPDAFTIPAIALIIMSFFYTAIDETMQWDRYLSGRSDRVEMWSHFFIILGHAIMVGSWYYWFSKGYQGVAETLPYLQNLG